jgi:hypothetical protein
MTDDARRIVCHLDSPLKNLSGGGEIPSKKGFLHGACTEQGRSGRNDSDL